MAGKRGRWSHASSVLAVCSLFILWREWNDGGTEVLQRIGGTTSRFSSSSSSSRRLLDTGDVGADFHSQVPSNASSPSSAGDSGGQRCEDLQKHVGFSSSCAMARAFESCRSGTYFEYIRFHFCTCGSMPAVSYLILGVWLVLLFYVLGNTAADYFCPSLEKLSEILHLPPTVAGVTLLPLGNGAPDVFASIASFVGAKAGEVGLNSVLGAGLFVTTVVAGSICMSVAHKKMDAKIDGASFLRDIGFLSAAVMGVVIIMLVGHVHLWGAVLFFSIYIVYGVTLTASEFLRRLARQQQPGSPSWLLLQSLSSGNPALQSTFRTSPRTPNQHPNHHPAASTASGRTPRASELLPVTTQPQGQTAGSGAGGGGGGGLGLTPFDGYSELPSDDADVAMARPYAADVGLPQWVWTSHYEMYAHHLHRGLERPLWGWSEEEEEEELPICSWQGCFEKLIETPLGIPRRMTIPSIDPDRWSRPTAVASAGLAPLLLMLVLGGVGKSGGDPTWAAEWWHWLVVGGVCAGVSGLAWMGTDGTGPPTRWVFPWVAGGFMMSILWFFLIANELVAVLVAFGVILEMNAALLGLTILAWGNSIGDFVANLALASNGSNDGVQIAMSGCYAGPMFNTLVGLGMSFVLASWHSYPASFTVPEDASLFWTAGFILLGLLLSSFFMLSQDMRPSQVLGLCLLLVYILFISLRVAAMAHVIKLPGL